MAKYYKSISLATGGPLTLLVDDGGPCLRPKPGDGGRGWGANEAGGT